MSDKTRKRIWLMPVAAAIGVVALLAVLAATVWTPSTAQAQAPFLPPGNLVATEISATQIDLSWSAGVGQTSYEVQRMTGSGAFMTVSTATNPGNATTYMDMGLTASTMYTYQVRGVNVDGPSAWAAVAMATTMAAGTSGTSGTGMSATGDMITSDSTSGGGAPQIELTIAELGMDLNVGSSIVLYLEDDFQEPDSIPMSSVYLVAEGGDMDQMVKTGNGSRVYVTSPVKIKTGAYFDDDKKDIAIRVLVPDMCTTDTLACQTSDGPKMGQKVTLVIESDSGIKNPSEAGTHSVFFDLLGAAARIPSASNVRDRNDAMRDADPPTERTLSTVAKISLSDVDDKRGYELTITGSGFNNGTTASAYVLKAASAPADCETLVSDSASTLIGSGLVGSDDKVTITAEVTVPSFGPGNVNQICMVDGENRYSSDIDDFKLESSIRIVPNMVNSGDTVNVFAQDYPLDASSGFEELMLAGQVVHTTGALNNAISVRATSLTDGSATATFDVPGSVGNKPLQGTVRVDATWGTTTENTLITVAGSELTSSASDILPNESITISGNGYGSQSCIDVADIKLDNVAVQVDSESTISCDTDGDGRGDVDGVEVSNSGQFVATITLWPDDEDAANPTLISGSHELIVEDSQGFIGSTRLTIAEPTISVLPDVVGPRDYVTISGENWPIDNTDNSNSGLVAIEISEGGRTRSYSVYADNTGRFSIEHRVSKDVAIPSTNQVKGNYSDGEIVKVGNFAVPAATVTVTPSSAQPGDMVNLSATDMPVYASADYVKIGGTVFNDPGANTDIDGNITIDGILVPGLDPGTYSVVINVDGTVAIGELEVLAEDSAAGAGAELPGALEELGDDLVRVFHFNGVDKSWDFYDPRPDFADLNTLTTLINGEPYWVLVSEGQEDVLLNGKARTLTCVGGDCWNQIVW